MMWLGMKFMCAHGKSTKSYHTRWFDCLWSLICYRFMLYNYKKKYRFIYTTWNLMRMDENYEIIDMDLSNF